MRKSPGDLRDEPENRDFLQRARARGVVLEPWLDGIGNRPVRHAEESPDLARDRDRPAAGPAQGPPLRHLHHAGAENFHTAVADAADVNQRLVQARLRDGTVVGRCLLSLLESGHVVVRRLAPITTSTFRALVDRFVDRLVVAMHARRAPGGKPADLLSRGSDNDAARDLSGGFGGFSTPTCSILRGAAPNGLRVALIERLRPISSTAARSPRCSSDGISA